MEYIEGESLERIVKSIIKSKNEKELQECLQILERVGELLARIHAFNIALGDTKPENIIVGKDNNIWIVDFEQTDRNGDRSWDIAEFVYYTGHYLSPFVDVGRAEKMAKVFLEGYLKAGGDPRTVKNAGSTKYTKVFSVFTFPHIMLVLSNVCKNVDEQGKKQW
jgi:tRNA A-37 threonylcarbamoyl transferase component Bud32